MVRFRQEHGSLGMLMAIRKATFAGLLLLASLVVSAGCGSTKGDVIEPSKGASPSPILNRDKAPKPTSNSGG